MKEAVWPYHMVFSTWRLSWGIRRKEGKTSWIQNPKRCKTHSLLRNGDSTPGWYSPLLAFFFLNVSCSCFPEPRCKQNSLTKKWGWGGVMCTGLFRPLPRTFKVDSAALTWQLLPSLKPALGLRRHTGPIQLKCHCVALEGTLRNTFIQQWAWDGEAKGRVSWPS